MDTINYAQLEGSGPLVHRVIDFRKDAVRVLWANGTVSAWVPMKDIDVYVVGLD
jgi:hypothetical protein